MSNSRMQIVPRPADPDWATDQTCINCHNRYVVLWIEPGAGWNDFGYRHCPFCGWAFDQATGAVVNDVI
jgi:hypothetical protein